MGGLVSTVGERQKKTLLTFHREEADQASLAFQQTTRNQTTEAPNGSKDLRGLAMGWGIRIRFGVGVRYLSGIRSMSFF